MERVRNLYEKDKNGERERKKGKGTQIIPTAEQSAYG